MAVLLLTAAAVLWIEPTGCAPLSATPQVATSAVSPSASASGVGRPAGAIPPGSVGVPVRLADPTALTVVRPGNRVDLLRLDNDRDRSVPVASGALVLEVTGADDPVTGGLLLALQPDEASRAISGSGRGFAIVIRPS
ncbi:hypothetical protein [Actinoplanes utahensis]|uniref:hypothetical protein n=1 Tax=Actinoplanes utahensis TaxID=1869 RepID=UPI001F2AA8D9|nr:hypothetical protein [Actinoplanes utahensis]